MQPDFSEELIERSLRSAASLAEAVIPLAMEAFQFSANQVRLTPPGGVDLDEANLQALPNLFRLNLLKLVAGHNRDAMTPEIRRRGSPNNGLWLGVAGTEQMARVYKVSKRYRVRQSGIYQEKLITQARYRDLLVQGELFSTEEVVLDALLMWQSQGYEMVSAFVVIPNGWDIDGRLVRIGDREVPLPDPLSGIATFPGVVDDRAVVGGEMPIVVPKNAPEVEESRSLLEEDDEALVDRDKDGPESE